MKLALAGDTMLGREVSRAITEAGPEALVADEVIDAAREADLFLLNLECCISERGEPWSEARKPFFFRAPPAAIDVLARLGVDCVTLANNHALDFGRDALLDTFEHLRAAGIAWVGGGAKREGGRVPAAFGGGGLRLAVLGCSDHPAECAAGVETPGIAYADLGHGLDWLPAAIAAAEADTALVTPHWGPNMAAEPTFALRRSARALRAAGAALVAGHSAHVFHAVEQGVLYDLGDFLDDYAVDPRLRNDLGLLFLVDLDRGGPASLEAVPLKLEFCHTRLARNGELAWIGRRFRHACRKFGTEVVEERERFVVRWRA
jgi:poly-gamma-glutamate capsule biosynthesis protein CapA/YwtB (metallophosphatase superfamily)